MISYWIGYGTVSLQAEAVLMEELYRWHKVLLHQPCCWNGIRPEHCCLVRQSNGCTNL